MKKKGDNLVENAKDTILGYATVLLALCLFILMLMVIIALARVLVG